mmetsp:Transcript_45488/g.145981  ORF Transcript_45488/g.145981 Transcript_45488/m.145981 type:complete len:333 (-) Transcript_45488:1955-2953(-)
MRYYVVVRLLPSCAPVALDLSTSVVAWCAFLQAVLSDCALLLGWLCIRLCDVQRPRHHHLQQVVGRLGLHEGHPVERWRRQLYVDHLGQLQHGQPIGCGCHHESDAVLPLPSATPGWPDGEVPDGDLFALGEARAGRCQPLIDRCTGSSWWLGGVFAAARAHAAAFFGEFVGGSGGFTIVVAGRRWSSGGNFGVARGALWRGTIRLAVGVQLRIRHAAGRGQVDEPGAVSGLDPRLRLQTAGQGLLLRTLPETPARLLQGALCAATGASHDADLLVEQHLRGWPLLLRLLVGELVQRETGHNGGRDIGVDRHGPGSAHLAHDVSSEVACVGR